ncbi:MAG: sugar-binding protein [Terracidiphilus sp.]
MSLSWTVVSGATSYNVYMNSGSTPIATGITTSSYMVWSQTFSTGVGLTNGTTYTFNVAALNSSGASALSSQVSATPAVQGLGTTTTPAVFNIYPQVLAPNPVPVGFNMQPAAGKNIMENAWLSDGGFSSYDARFSLTATQNGTATSFIAENNGSDGGTDFWDSITTGYFVGATAYTYRYSSGEWSLLRSDTVTGYTADGESETPANCTITFANSGPATESGDIIWLVMDNVEAVPNIQYLDARFSAYYPNWSIETQGGESRTVTWPYTLSTNVPSSDAGGRSLELTDTNTETNGIWQYVQGAFVGPANEEFQSGHTYEVSVWLMQSGIASGNVTFSMNGLGISHVFTGVNSTWQQFTWTFPAVAGLATGSAQPGVHLDFGAPGTLWVDNFQLYDTAWPPNTLNPTVMTAWQNYHPGTIRIWSNFGLSNTSYGFFSLNSWLTPEIKTRNTQGIGNDYELPGQLEHLPDALANVKAAGANPWLLINMSLSPTEWGELIDYLSAPVGTGYASMRPASHPGPYTADFGTIYIELGDEEWGTQVVPADTAYGQWADFVISQAIANKSYFNSSEIKFVLNSFTLNPSFGSAAITAAPQASLVDYFLYTSGSSTGNAVNTLAGDQYYQSDLVQVPMTNGPWINAIVAQQQLDASNGHNYAVTSYEEGPGTDTYGGNTVGDDTLAAAIASIDTTLYATQSGFGSQNLFMFSLGTGPYTTHTNFANGFFPHPIWEANQMRNSYCSGPMVLTNAKSNNPTYSDPNITLGNAVPLIAVYTFADAGVANQADVVVISRSLANQTPVTLNFPAVPTGTAQLYTLTGDPRGTNNNALNIPIGSRPVTVTQSYTFTMPPGSMYIFQVPMSGAWSSSGEPAPPAPASLTAVAGNGKVTLTWAGSTGAIGYNVLRGTVSGGPYTQVGTPTVVAYTDRSVTNATTYYYVVEATNGGGASAPSPQASATPNVLDDAVTSTQPPLTGANTGAWTNASFIPLSHYFNGFSTDTAQYKTLWDTNYLYLLVSVQDSYLIAPTEADIWSGETVEVYFSGTDTQSTLYGPTDFQYAFPYGSGGAVVTESKHNAVSGIIFGQENISGGYQMAIAIPWTTLGTTPVAGTQYGFDVMIDTATALGTQLGKLAWWATVNDTWNNPSAMGPLVLTSGGGGGTQQTISFTAPTSPVTYGVSPISLSASATSGLVVTFSVVSGPGTVSGNTLTVTGVGTIVVAANQVGNGSYAAAPQVTHSIVVNQASQTITFAAPISPVTYGVSPITLSASASSGLAVTFSVVSGPGTVSGNTLTVTGAGTVVVAANQAGNGTYTAAAQVTHSVVVNAVSGGGTLLSYEPFGEASGAALNGATGSGDSGWGAAWVEQSGSTVIPGYEILSTTPLTYTGLQTTGNYAVGGFRYQSAGRQLNVTASGPYSSYLSNGLIGASGTSIWLSFLIREDVSNGDINAVFLNNYSSSNSWVPNSSDSIGIGYFGGTADWGLTYNDGTPVLSNVAVVQGQPTLMVVEITFGSTNVISLYVNPTSLGGSAPATPSATISTAGNIAFESFAYEGGYATNDSSLADIRFGTTYAAVTP